MPLDFHPHFPESVAQVVDSVVGQVANLRPIVNRPSPSRNFLPPEKFPRGTGSRFCARRH
jgi:hypothetical protein